MQTNPSPFVPASEQLGAARRAIDLVDDELLRLIEQRFELSARIAGVKSGDDRRLKIRPKREAEVLDRLVARASTATPSLIAHVWRELMAHSVQAQVPTALVVHAPNAGADLGDRVRERFGRAAPIVVAEGPADAIRRAREEEAIAVVALDDSGWWRELADDPVLTIFDSIATASGQVLLVGRIAAEDVAPGCGLQVRSDAVGDVVARAGDLALYRESVR